MGWFGLQRAHIQAAVGRGRVDFGWDWDWLGADLCWVCGGIWLAFGLAPFSQK